MPDTTTDPNGIVHQLDDHMTRCGLNADGWSRAITIAQLAGLVIFCEECYA